MFTININNSDPGNIPPPIDPKSLEYRLKALDDNRYRYKSLYSKKVYIVIRCSNGLFIVDGISAGGPHLTLEDAISAIDKMELGSIA